MPGGTQSNTGTSTTTVQAPQGVNPYLTSLYTSLFGGAAPGAVQTLQDAQSGKLLSNNIASIYGTLNKAGQQQYQQGLSDIRLANARAGTRFSTDTAAQTGAFAQNYISQLNQQAAQLGLSEMTQQIGAAEGITQPFAATASTYYSPGQTTTQKGKVSLPWSTGVQAIASLFA